MKKNKVYLVIFILGVFSSCEINSTKEPTKNVALINFWDSFVEAIDIGNEEHLIRNSDNTIKCGVCGLEEKFNEMIDAKDLFKNYIDQISPPPKTIYSVSKGNGIDTLYQINYNTGYKEKYNLIFLVGKFDKEFRFQGVYTVP